MALHIICDIITVSNCCCLKRPIKFYFPCPENCKAGSALLKGVFPLLKLCSDWASPGSAFPRPPGLYNAPQSSSGVRGMWLLNNPWALSSGTLLTHVYMLSTLHTCQVKAHTGWYPCSTLWSTSPRSTWKGKSRAEGGRWCVCVCMASFGSRFGVIGN